MLRSQNRSHNRSQIKRSRDKSSISKIDGSRFMSRMKSSIIAGSTKYRKKGSSKYSIVRENGDPIIYREGIDVTPIPIQIDQQYHDNNNNNNNNYADDILEHETNFNCFIPLTDPIYAPIATTSQLFDNNNNNNNNHDLVNNDKLMIIRNDKDKDKDKDENKENEYILEENIEIELCETNTKILFEMTNLAISNRETSNNERENVIKMNKNYENCLLKHNDKDLFTTSYTQTNNITNKDESIQVKPPQTCQKGTQSSKFDIYDSFNNDLSLNKIQTSSKFKKNLETMERAIIQNVMAEQQMLYRINTNSNINNKINKENESFELFDDDNNNEDNNDNNDDNDDNDDNDKIKNNDDDDDNMIELLWEYSCEECINLECTTIDYNLLNKDLIVGGYGSWKFGNKENGKIMFWTLKNPTNPIRVYDINNTCVVSSKFSKINPYLLSVGLYDGNINIYDIRTEINKAIFSSKLNKHTAPVWNVLWSKNKLYSTSSDGIVKQWSMKKGFNSINIMSLKRVPNLSAKRGSIIDNTIKSRQGSALCFDFPNNSLNNNNNNDQYFIGTEDGIIHKCSISYNEQVLNTYYGHNGPIYKIQCSPFDSNKFITCSSDWTINIWTQNKSNPNLTLIPSNINETIVDCCWSPFKEEIFASATESGILSIWDLDKNKKDPIINQNTKQCIKQIMFAPNCGAILCAQSNANIQVYRQ